MDFLAPAALFGDVFFAPAALFGEAGFAELVFALDDFALGFAAEVVFTVGGFAFGFAAALFSAVFVSPARSAAGAADLNERRRRD